MYTVTKTYGHELGLSAVFRQHHADSHCAKLHGYALSFEFVFGCHSLDKNGWVIDFGSLDGLKQWLVEMFDHKLIIAEDDPALGTFMLLSADGLADVVQARRTGCEAFAQFAYEAACNGLAEQYPRRGLRVLSVTVREHGANAATYYPEDHLR